tara:strand:- start:1991 stop:2152 length:162 start_codon:yes stop_codon:yes gene_type:complete
MAQEKRLTRAQKILLSQVKEGRRLKEFDQSDAKELEKRGLIRKNHSKGWEVVK